MTLSPDIKIYTKNEIDWIWGLGVALLDRPYPGVSIKWEEEDAKAVFNQAKAYPTLVEFINGFGGLPALIEMRGETVIKKILNFISNQGKEDEQNITRGFSKT